MRRGGRQPLEQSAPMEAHQLEMSSFSSFVPITVIPILLFVGPSTAFLPQRGAKQSCGGSRWAGELGHGRPSGQDLCGSPGAFKAFKWPRVRNWAGKEQHQWGGTVWVTPLGPSRPCAIAHLMQLFTVYCKVLVILSFLWEEKV